MAKLVSSFGHDRVLESHDPVFNISYRNVFWVVGALELGISLIGLVCEKNNLRVALLAWISTSFLIYRIGMPLVGYNKPCPCLGNLTGIIHISSQTADIAMKIILTYLLVGSYATLFLLWRQHKKNHCISMGEAAHKAAL